MRHLIIILALSLLLLAGCHRKATRADLLQAEQLADSLPAQTLAILDTIDSSTLSGHDLFLHRFLTIKARDKQFITHTSDTLLLLALDYARSHRSSVNYPEVLYYAGRVYTDLGDYPTALDYYYSSLDEIPENQDLKLRAKVLSNIGFIYKCSCQHEESIKYFEKAITIDSILNDSIYLMYDMIDLGDVYLKMNEYEIAESIYKKVKEFSFPSYPEIEAEQAINIAGIRLMKNDYSTAIRLARNNINKVDSQTQEKAFSFLARAYYHSQKLDSAYYYSNKILKSKNPTYKPTAYTLLLSKNLIGRSPHQMISEYIRGHNDCLNSILQKNNKEQLLLKSSQYDYSVQERDRIKAEKTTYIVIGYLNIALIVIVIILLIIFIFYSKTKRQQIKISGYERDILQLKADLAQAVLKELKEDKKEKAKTPKANLLEKLKEKKEGLCINNKILNSSAMKKLRDSIKDNKALGENNPVWSDLKDVVLSVHPNFIKRLELLVGRNIKNTELQTALLIKCGFSPTEMAVLLGLEKGSVSHRRKVIGEGIFNEKVPVQEVDMIIRKL